MRTTHIRTVLVVVAALLMAGSVLPVFSQAMPEYGVVLGGPKPGGFVFPDIGAPVPASPQAQSPAKQPPGDIAFVHKGDVYAVTTDGRYFRRLTSDGRNAFPMWSPDGKYIAFSKAARAVPGQGALSADVWIMTSDGKYTRQLGRTRLYRAVYPCAWLPGGKGLLVSVHFLESDVTPELKIVTLDGKPYPLYARWMAAGKKAGFVKDRQESDPAFFCLGQAGAFSTAGKTMVFTASTEYLANSARLDLFRMAVEGTKLSRVAEMPYAYVECLRWNPAAAKIISAEERNVPEREYEAGIWLRDVNGAQLKKLADTGTASFCGMDWSPKGEYIVYQVTDSRYPRFEHPESFPTLSSRSSIWVMKADGTGRYKLADGVCHPNWR